MKKITALILALILTAACLTGCSSDESSGSPSPESGASKSSDSGSSGSSSKSSDSKSEGSGGEEASEAEKAGNFTVSGSTALQPLLTQAVDSFKSDQEFKGAITINGGGSGQGLLDVAAGAVHIGTSDISFEQAGLDGMGLVDHQVAIVAVAVVVSADVAANLEDISVIDLKGIFTGTITDWKQVAGWKGVSLPIGVFYHKAGSGIRVLFETFGILTPLTDAQIAPFGNFTQVAAGNLQTVLETGKGAIGYEALPYCSRLTKLMVDGYEANYENVYSGKYKIWGCEHMYTMGEPAGGVKAFLEYVTTSDFEERITEGEYGLISEMKVSR